MSTLVIQNTLAAPERADVHTDAACERSGGGLTNAGNSVPAGPSISAILCCLSR